jgi:hypothetical protein
MGADMPKGQGYFNEDEDTLSKTRKFLMGLVPGGRETTEAITERNRRMEEELRGANGSGADDFEKYGKKVTGKG